MDKTKEYILMCERAVEIQNLKPHVKFNYFAGDKSREIYYGGIDPIETNYIWLPTQSQLQGMVLPSKCNAYWLVNQMNCMCTNDNAYGLCGNPSMEQLWLAFVMKEKYQKTWGGKDWINS